MPDDNCPKCNKPKAAGPECPRCGVIYAKAGKTRPMPPKKTRPLRFNNLGQNQQGISLDCSACKGEKTMHSGSVSRFSGIVRFIGYLIVTPSVIGVILAFIMFFATGAATSEVMNVSHSEAEQAGAAIGGAIGFGFAIFMGCASLMGGLVGWLLLLKKKVYKCNVCGFILDRA